MTDRALHDNAGTAHEARIPEEQRAMRRWDFAREGKGTEDRMRGALVVCWGAPTRLLLCRARSTRLAGGPLAVYLKLEMLVVVRLACAEEGIREPGDVHVWKSGVPCRAGSRGVGLAFGWKLGGGGGACLLGDGGTYWFVALWSIVGGVWMRWRSRRREVGGR